MTPLEAFYRGGPDHAGRTREAILAWPDVTLEKTHDWIQWVFPLRIPSMFNLDAPILTDADVEAFRDTDLQKRLLGSTMRFLRFLNLADPWWAQPGNHNHLRVTRLLGCLRQLHQPFLAEAILLDLLAVYPYVDATTRRYWEQAVWL